MLPIFPPFDYNQPALLQNRLREALPFLHRIIYDTVIDTALQENQTIYLVGGIVRDLFLGRPNFDLDFVCSDHAHYLAGILSAVFKSLLQVQSVKLTLYTKFGTARLDLVFNPVSNPNPIENQATQREEIHVDIATARLETYAHPAALPDVQFPATLIEDLRRRDFTINALALMPIANGLQLVDPFEGLTDLREGWLRVLHTASFEDDPTRILRGVRFAARFGYRFEAETASLLQIAVINNYLQKLSPERIRNEILLILREIRPEVAVQLLQDYAILATIYPFLIWDNQNVEEFRQIRQLLVAHISPAAYLATLCYRLEPVQVQEFVRSLRFFDANEKVPIQVSQFWQERAKLATPQLANSDLYALLQPYANYTLEVAAALCQIHRLTNEATRINFYLTKLKDKKPRLGGDFLLKAGLQPGPRFRQILNSLHIAVLDGLVETRAEEEAFLLQNIDPHNKA